MLTQYEGILFCPYKSCSCRHMARAINSSLVEECQFAMVTWCDGIYVTHVTRHIVKAINRMVLAKGMRLMTLLCLGCVMNGVFSDRAIYNHWISEYICVIAWCPHCVTWLVPHGLFVMTGPLSDRVTTVSWLVPCLFVMTGDLSWCAIYSHRVHMFHQCHDRYLVCLLWLVPSQIELYIATEYICYNSIIACLCVMMAR